MIRQKRNSRLELRNNLLLAVFLPIILPLLLVAVTLFFLYRTTLYLLVWTLWLPRGKDVLFVCSDSPIWGEHMASEILPLVQKRAVVLNWSQRKSWRKWSLPVRIFYHFGGDREFNPLVVLFRPARRAKVFRFWRAFKDWKHGRTEAVGLLVQNLRNAL